MKRIKYMHSLQRSKKLKQDHSLPSKPNSNPQHLQSLKTEAIKTLYNIQHDYFAKTQLNITLRTSHTPLNTQYKKRSLSQKENHRKTSSSSLCQAKSLNKNKKQAPFQPFNMNIKKLLRYPNYFLRIKTQQLHQQQSKLLKNPFYKIQKNREANQSTHIEQNKKKIVQNVNINQQLNSTQQKSSQSQKNVFVPRDKKQWYFASKKFRFRTVHHEKSQSTIQDSQRSNRISKFNLSNLSKIPLDHIKIQPLTHQRKESTSSSSQSPDILQFNRFDSIMHEHEAIIMEQSRQQSPMKIRQKSLTVKYNEIKDYFQKKYHKKSIAIEDQSFAGNFSQYDQMNQDFQS